MKFLKTHYGRAIRVIPSDTVDIPNPSGLGTTGTCTDTVANKIIDDTANFTSNLAGSIVVNNNNRTTANVLKVEDENTIVLDADIFVSGESYLLYSYENNQGCSLYIPAQTPGQLTVETIGGDFVTLEGCGSVDESIILPISVKSVKSTNTEIENIIALW